MEDTLGDVWNTLKVVLTPFGHVLRLGFGLSLLFYGMAFRTFAFHVIVFRIAGFKQVRTYGRPASMLLSLVVGFLLRAIMPFFQLVTPLNYRCTVYRG